MKSAQNQPKTTYLQKSLINVVPEKVHTSHPHPVKQMPNENIMYVQQVFYSIRRCSCVMCFFIRTLFYSSLLGGSSISAHVYFGRKKKTRQKQQQEKPWHCVVSEVGPTFTMPVDGDDVRVTVLITQVLFLLSYPLAKIYAWIFVFSSFLRLLLL